MSYIDTITYNSTSYGILANEPFQHICDITLSSDTAITQSLATTTNTYWKKLYLRFSATYSSTKTSPTAGMVCYFQYTASGTVSGTSAWNATFYPVNSSSSVSSGTYYADVFFEMEPLDDSTLSVCRGFSTKAVLSTGNSYLYENASKTGYYSKYTNHGVAGLYISSPWTNGTIVVYGIPV